MNIAQIGSQQNITNLHIQNIYEEIRLLRGAGDPAFLQKICKLTNQITQLLATRRIEKPNALPRVSTLPDAVDYIPMVDQQPSTLNQGESHMQKTPKFSPNPAPAEGQQSELPLARSIDSVKLDPESSLVQLTNAPEWIRETNEVLRALNLPEITACHDLTLLGAFKRISRCMRRCATQKTRIQSPKDFALRSLI